MQLSISENAHRNEIDHKTNTENILLIARTPAAKCECSSVGNCLLLRIKKPNQHLTRAHRAASQYFDFARPVVVKNLKPGKRSKLNFLLLLMSPTWSRCCFCPKPSPSLTFPMVSSQGWGCSLQRRQNVKTGHNWGKPLWFPSFWQISVHHPPRQRRERRRDPILKICLF